MKKQRPEDLRSHHYEVRDKGREKKKKQQQQKTRVRRTNKTSDLKIKQGKPIKEDIKIEGIVCC